MQSPPADVSRNVSIAGGPASAGAWEGLRSVPLVAVLQWMLLLLLIANLGRIPIATLGGRGVPVLVNDLVVATTLALAAVAFIQSRRLELDHVAVLALLFGAVGGISAVLAIPRFGLSAGAVVVSLGYLARWLFYLAVYIVVTNVARPQHVTRLWGALETTILLFAAFGILQSIFLPNFALIVYPDARHYLDWDPQGHRLVSTFLDPNYAGAFIIIALLVGLGQLAMGVPVAWWKLGLLFAALLMTASRSALLAFVVGGTVVMAVRGLSRRLMRTAALGAVAVVAALPWLLEFARSFNKLELDASALTRVMNWVHGIEVFIDHPILGIGFNTWGFVQSRYPWASVGEETGASFGIAGGLLFVAALTGVVGLAIYIAMMWSVARRARRTWRDTDLPAAHRGIALGGGAMVPAIIVHSLFTNSIFFPYLMEALWVLWALTFAMSRPSTESDRRAGNTFVPRARVRIVAPPASPGRVRGLRITSRTVT